MLGNNVIRPWLELDRTYCGFSRLMLFFCGQIDGFMCSSARLKIGLIRIVNCCFLWWLVLILLF